MRGGGWRIIEERISPGFFHVVFGFIKAVASTIRATRLSRGGRLENDEFAPFLFTAVIPKGHKVMPCRVRPMVNRLPCGVVCAAGDLSSGVLRCPYFVDASLAIKEIGIKLTRVEQRLSDLRKKGSGLCQDDTFAPECHGLLPLHRVCS